MSDFDEILVIGHPSKQRRIEQQQFHQHAALRYLIERCTSLEGYDAAVAMLERQYDMALPGDLRQQSRRAVQQRLATGRG